MSKTDVWMPLFIGDYLADTTRLTTEQHGAYFLLIMDYWRNGAPPDDDAILGNITKLQSKDWKRVKPCVMAFFALKDGKWHHARIDRELSSAADNKRKHVEKAQKAAEKRWSQASVEHQESDATSNATSIPPSSASSNASSNSQAMLESCPSPSPLPSSLKAKSKACALATRLPADWLPSDNEIGFCKNERPELDPIRVADEFRDYWIAQPGMKGRKTDWPATWRNWVRKQRAMPQRGLPEFSNFGKHGQQTAINAQSWLDDLNTIEEAK